MNDAVQRGKIQGFKVAETGSVISHLQFADDTLIFIDANYDEVTRLFIILSLFEVLTGMKLNLEKSTMVSIGADDVVKTLLKNLVVELSNFHSNTLEFLYVLVSEAILFGIMSWRK